MSWSSWTFVSCAQSRSGRIAAMKSRKPFFQAARRPLTFQEISFIVFREGAGVAAAPASPGRLPARLKRRAGRRPGRGHSGRLLDRGKAPGIGTDRAGEGPVLLELHGLRLA